MKKGSMIRSFLTVFIALLLCTGCDTKEQGRSTKNTYYIELLNYEGPVKDYIQAGLSGKVSFKRGEEVQIVPEPMVNKLTAEMHYYRLIEELKNEIPEGTMKITLELRGGLVKDSTSYGFPRYRYKNGKWELISSMGLRPVRTKIVDSTNHYRPDFIGKEIITNVVNSTYER